MNKLPFNDLIVIMSRDWGKTKLTTLSLKNRTGSLTDHEAIKLGEQSPKTPELWEDQCCPAQQTT